MDDEIVKSRQKTKTIRKNKGKKFMPKERNERKERRFIGDKKRRGSGDGIVNKSRNVVFGKKKFIKRFKGKIGGQKIKTE